MVPRPPPGPVRPVFARTISSRSAAHVQPSGSLLMARLWPLKRAKTPNCPPGPEAHSPDLHREAALTRQGTPTAIRTVCSSVEPSLRSWPLALWPAARARASLRLSLRHLTIPAAVSSGSLSQMSTLLVHSSLGHNTHRDPRVAISDPSLWPRIPDCENIGCRLLRA